MVEKINKKLDYPISDIHARATENTNDMESIFAEQTEAIPKEKTDKITPKEKHRSTPAAKIEKQSAENLAYKLYHQIKNGSLNANTIHLLMEISDRNVAYVTKYYTEKYKSSLAKDIDDEWGLNYKHVHLYICHKLEMRAKQLEIPVKDYRKITDIGGLNKWINDISEEIQKTETDMTAELDETPEISTPPKINQGEYTYDALCKLHATDAYTVTHNKNKVFVTDRTGSYFTSKVTTYTHISDSKLRITTESDGFVKNTLYENGVRKNEKLVYSGNDEECKNRVIEHEFDGNGTIVKTTIKNADGQTTVEEYKDGKKHRISKYDKDGSVISQNSYYQPASAGSTDSIADNIYNGMHHEYNRFRMVKTSVIAKHIENIDKENVADVLKAYEKKNTGSLFKNIYELKGIRDTEKYSYIKYISIQYLNAVKEQSIPAKECLSTVKEIAGYIIAFAKSSGYATQDVELLINKEIARMEKSGKVDIETLANYLDTVAKRVSENNSVQKISAEKAARDAKVNKSPNGKIDSNFWMGRTGDCWFVAAMKSMVKTEKGLDILNNSIKLNNNGSITVHLQGVNKTYTVTKEEIQSSVEFARGDLDARAIEIAANKYMLENKQHDMNGNNLETAYRILVSNKPITTFINNPPKNYKEIINNKKYLVQAGINKFDMKTLPKVYYPGLGKYLTLGSPHAYSVIKADDNFVYLEDPRYEKGQFKVPLSMYEQYFHEFEYAEL